MNLSWVRFLLLTIYFREYKRNVKITPDNLGYLWKFDIMSNYKEAKKEKNANQVLFIGGSGFQHEAYFECSA